MATPFDISPDLRIIIAGSDIDARLAIHEDCATPIECAFGNESIVDDLELDHHGSMSHLEGVAIRAYRDHFGRRRDNPVFVVTGFPDEDACFAIAALAGIIPHPSMADRFPKADRLDHLIARQNLEHLARRINEVDIDPSKAVDLVGDYWGRVILTWRQESHPTCKDILSWYGGVDRWRAILSSDAGQFVDHSVEVMHERMKSVDSAPMALIGEVVVVDFTHLGPNSAYYKRWLDRHPILVAFVGGPTGDGTCSFILRDEATAHRIGSYGLRSAYPLLSPYGCGGREMIGGSSRVHPVTWDHALGYGEQISTMLD